MLLDQQKTQSEGRLAHLGSTLMYLLFTYKLCIIFFRSWGFSMTLLIDQLDKKEMHKNREALKNILN